MSNGMEVWGFPEKGGRSKKIVGQKGSRWTFGGKVWGLRRLAREVEKVKRKAKTLMRSECSTGELVSIRV